MPDSLTGALALAAITVGALHTMAPDHWVPLTALAQAQGWSRARAVRITALCGFGHVTVSVVLGVLALSLGLELLRTVGERMAAVAGLLLIGFGLTYAIVGLRRVARRVHSGHSGPHAHGHAHRHLDHVHEPSRMTPWALFLVYSADPCVALIPILFAAVPLGLARTAIVVGAYEAATIGTMIGLVVPACAAVTRVRLPWAARYGDTVAGTVIASVGVLVAALGW